jgi:hypothetical protein
MICVVNQISGVAGWQFKMFSICSMRGGDRKLHIEFHTDNFNMASNIKMSLEEWSVRCELNLAG